MPSDFAPTMTTPLRVSGGEADLILAKHRNGPTKTITVAHYLHLSRFTNMAKA